MGTWNMETGREPRDDSTNWPHSTSAGCATPIGSIIGQISAKRRMKWKSAAADQSNSNRQQTKPFWEILFKEDNPQTVQKGFGLHICASPSAAIYRNLASAGVIGRPIMARQT